MLKAEKYAMIEHQQGSTEPNQGSTEHALPIQTLAKMAAVLYYIFSASTALLKL